MRELVRRVGCVRVAWWPGLCVHLAAASQFTAQLSRAASWKEPHKARRAVRVQVSAQSTAAHAEHFARSTLQNLLVDLRHCTTSALRGRHLRVTFDKLNSLRFRRMLNPCRQDFPPFDLQ